MKVAQEVQVVFHTIDPVQEAIFIFNIAIDVGIQLSLVEPVDGWMAMFGPQDQVIQDSPIA